MLRPWDSRATVPPRRHRDTVVEDSMETADKVREIISQQLDVDASQIKDEAQFIDDLGADSLAIVELVLAFEEQFDIEIPDEDTEKIRTVGDAVSYIQARTSSN
jgi:acyl carrier protein